MKFQIFTLSALLFASATSHSQTRSGKAAYHFSSGKYTTCSRYEPIGSILRVSNPSNGKSILVSVNGRGPYNGNRILDLSTGSFSALYGGLGRGVGPVRYTVVSRPNTRGKKRRR